MADTEKTVLVNVKLAAQDAQTNMSNLEGVINDLAQATQALKAVTENTQQAFTGYNEKLNQSKLTAQQNREEITRLNLVRKQEAEAIRNAKGQIDAAEGSYKQAQQTLTKLGNAIKTAKDGFTSTSPAIKAQIKEYNDLNTKLKAFDEQMGNHQRKVGSYTEALSGVNSALSRLIPGFSQFSGILQTASKGFNAMGAGATEAGEGMETAEVAAGGLTAATIGLTAGLAAFIGVAVITVDYLSQFAGYSDMAAAKISGLKAGWGSFLNSIANGDWSNMFKNIDTASTLAAAATINLKDLERQALVSQEETANEDAKLGVLMKTFRDKAVDATEKQKAYNEALSITNGQYERNHKIGIAAYNMSILQLSAKANLNDEQTKDLFISEKKNESMADLSKAYDVAIEKAYKLIKANDLDKDILKQSADALGMLTSIDSKKMNQQEMFKVREDNAQAKAEAAREKEEQELARIKQETEQMESDRIDAISKTLQFQNEAFAKELSHIDENYRQKLFKLKKFIEDQQIIIDSKKSTGKEKTAAKGAISAANLTMGGISGEQSAETTKFLEDHAKKVLEIAQKGVDELTALQIKSVEDAHQRDIQSENLSYKEKKEAYDKQFDELSENETKLNTEIKKATGERLNVLKQELADTQNLINIANDKMVEEQLQHQKKLEDIGREFIESQKLIYDKVKIIDAELNAGGESSPSNKKELDAKKQLLADEDKADQANEKYNDSQKILLHREYLLKIKQLDNEYAKQKKQFEIQTAKEVADTGFNILQQSMQRANEANQINMERQKGYELSNQSLTETQKYEVSEKYRILEGKAKVKAFHQQQELDIAKAAISGALAIIAAEEQPYVAPFIIPGIIITTALSIAEIAAQKAPAYASGGIHYNSDGKGGVLPGYSKTDNTNAYLRSGEAVVVSEAMRDPWARNMVSAINQSYGGRSFDSTIPVNPWFSPGFTSGGVFNNYLPTGDNGLRPQIQSSNNGRLHPDDIGSIVTGMVNAVSSLPNPVVDVKDINYEQGRLARTIDRATY